MTRKDTILIAVVINAGLLAILFTTAVIYDTDQEQSEFLAKLPDDKFIENSQSQVAISSTGDEVDNVLQYYSHPMVVETPTEIEKMTVVPNEITKNSEPTFVEVKVKKGDALEKIAKEYHTTVATIKQYNHLKTENLSVGQVLKIPVAEEEAYSKKIDESKKEEGHKELYYVIKKGDNPWKVAKQFDVNYADILRLNHLDEEKARNLKIGDRIRVK